MVAKDIKCFFEEVYLAEFLNYQNKTDQHTYELSIIVIHLNFCNIYHSYEADKKLEKINQAWAYVKDYLLLLVEFPHCK